VNTVSPGFFETDMGAGPGVRKTALEMAVLGRTGDPRELKGVRTASESSRHRVADGQPDLPLPRERREHLYHGRRLDLPAQPK
jgi:NAD(P)-dependent dehydrogenase (short-subunit alcohol dehydrogenase family)